jgi:hypothetical protein
VLLKDSTLLILLFGIVVVFALISPSIINAGTGFLAGLKDFINTGLENFANIGQSGGFTSLSMTVYYTDGSSKDFHSDTFQVLPMKLYDSGLEVSKIEVSAYATIIYEGTVNSWSAEGTFKAYYFTEGFVSNPKQILSETLSVNSAESWTSDTARNIATFSYTASQIEDAIATVAEMEVGNHAMYFELDATLTLTFADASKDAKTTNGYIEWAFYYTKDHTFQSLSIELRTSPIP